MKKILLALLVIIACILAYAATRPGSYEVSRSMTMKASPDKLLGLTSDFHAWGAWSPWEKKDPNMKRTFGGSPMGVGSTYAWEGNKDVGAGRMEITSATPAGVGLKMDFLKPMEAHDDIDFTFTPRGDSTVVRWAIRGPVPYVAKVMTVFVSMDKMIAPDFEAGLKNLKVVAEK